MAILFQFEVQRCERPPRIGSVADTVTPIRRRNCRVCDTYGHGFRALRHLPSPLNGECLLCGAAARRGSQSCLPAAGTFIAALRPEIFGVTAHKPCTFPREEIACTDYRGAAFKLLAEIEQRQSKY